MPQTVISLPERGYAKFQDFDSAITSVASSCALPVKDSLSPLPSQNENMVDAAYYFSLGEYMQSWRYFEHVEPDLRAMFRFRPAIQKAADQIIQQSILYRQQGKDNVTFVAVHVRRTTRASWIREAPPSFFVKAMADFRDKLNAFDDDNKN